MASIVVKEGPRGKVLFAKFRLADGTQRKIRLGILWEGKGKAPEGYVTKRSAEAKLNEVIAEAKAGKYEPAAPTNDVTFWIAVTTWLDWAENDRKRKHSTVFHYKNSAMPLIRFFGSDTLLSNITKDDVERFRRELLKEGKSNRTINKFLTLLNGIFVRAEKQLGHVGNPVVGVERQPRNVSNDMQTYEPDELRSLAEAALTPMEGALFLTAGFCGLRMGELRALRWIDVDFERRTIMVRQSHVLGVTDSPKSGKVRPIPMHRGVSDALRGLPQGDGLVFPGPTGNELDSSWMRKRYISARDAAGLRPLRFHDLRHTAITLMARPETGFTPFEVKEMAGHADMATTMKYIHHVGNGVAAAEKMDRAYG